MLYIKTLISILFCSSLLITSSDIQAQSFHKNHATEFKSGNAYNFSSIKYSDTTFHPITNYKSPVTAGLLSLGLPGFAAGQFYNEQPVKGLIHVVISAGSVLIALLVRGEGHPDLGGIFVGGILFACNWTWSIIDAIVSANIINNKNELLNYQLKKKWDKKHKQQ
jgi:hypothetical protein